MEALSGHSLSRVTVPGPRDGLASAPQCGSSGVKTPSLCRLPAPLIGRAAENGAFVSGETGLTSRLWPAGRRAALVKRLEADRRRKCWGGSGLWERGTREPTPPQQQTFWAKLSCREVAVNSPELTPAAQVHARRWADGTKVGEETARGVCWAQGECPPQPGTGVCVWAQSSLSRQRKRSRMRSCVCAPSSDPQASGVIGS